MMAATSATPSTVRANCSTTRIDTPVARDLGDDAVQLLDDERRQAHRQLVEQQHGRIGREATGHREHLLLAARHRAGQLAAAFLESGELRVGDRLDVRRALRPA